MPKLRRLENRSDGCPAGAVIWCEQHAYDRYIRRKSAEPVDDTEPLTWPPSDAGKLEPDDVENFRTLSSIEIINRGRKTPAILPQAELEPPEEQSDDVETTEDVAVHEPNDDSAGKPARKSKPGKRANRNSG